MKMCKTPNHNHLLPEGSSFKSVQDRQGCRALEYLEEQQQKEGGGAEPKVIRLQAGADACMNGIKTKKDAIHKINEVKLGQDKFLSTNADNDEITRTSELYHRDWMKVIDGDDESVTNQEKAKKMAFTAMQFNVLAQGLSSGPDVETPFDLEKPSKKGTFGGFTDIPNPQISLDFDSRQWRLLEAMLGNDNEGEFDLIGMEEVDRFYGFFEPVMKLFGYCGVFLPKPHAPGVDFGWYSDGCALFWKESEFEAITTERFHYNAGSGNQGCLVTTLKHRSSGKTTVVAVTHLKAKEGHEEVRAKQALQILNIVQKAASKVSKSEDVPILIFGDFNAEPTGETDKDGNQISSVQNILNSAITKFSSAYELDNSYLTTCKIRGPKVTSRIIDYMFYGSSKKEGGSIKCTHVLEIPKEDDLEKSKLPGFRYPSDHISLGAKFLLSD